MLRKYDVRKYDVAHDGHDGHGALIHACIHTYTDAEWTELHVPPLLYFLKLSEDVYDAGFKEITNIRKL